ncbi:MAG: type II toxin-antitoxin system VapC family toxin [Defluviitaleaceae bacterium]|nr:type II toxin-antitoxin system VapC family toxin [Defluviitaleaceae bacterium]
MGTVNYLFDTHTILWALRKPEKVGKLASEVIKNVEVQKFVSPVSAYEIMYKHKIGKLSEFDDIAQGYFFALRTLGAAELPIDMRHAHFAGKLDWEHRDPFDRLLTAQSIVDEMVLLTNDPVFGGLPSVKTLW